MADASPSDPLCDEPDRLATLHELALLDSEPEREFDTLVALAAQLLDCPAALLNLVDRDRVWVKASTLPVTREVPREISLCDRTVGDGEVVVIEDVALDGRFGRSPLVIRNNVRFYAGAPLCVPDNEGVRRAVGTLCVFDTVPRTLDQRQRQSLIRVAALAEALLEARRTALKAIHIATVGEQLVTQLARQDQIFRTAEQMAMIGWWRVNVADGSVEWSDNVYRIHGLPVGQRPTLEEALRFYPGEQARQVADALRESIATGKPFDTENDFVTVDGRWRRVRSVAEPEIVDGRVAAIIGVVHDITERYALETKLRRSADVDALTGIANRASFDRELEQAMQRARTHRTPLYLALIDLDGFKSINDTLGHGAGDDVLRMTGAALTQPWLLGSIAARIGGDEFALIVDRPELLADLDELRTGIEASLRVAVEVNGMRMTSAGSVGIAAFDEECHSLRDFARRADMVLYAAKRGRVGRRRFGNVRRAA